MRDNKVLETFMKHTEKKLKEMDLFKHLKKEVETGANGTQDYIIKKGVNKDKLAKTKQRRENMTDDLQLIDQLKKRINATIDQIKEAMITGAVDNMEKYKYMLGQAQAYQLVLQEISNLRKPKEQKDEQGNIIDLGQGSTKN